MVAGRTTAVGLFHDPERARDAIAALKDAGFRGDDISLLMQDRGEARDMAADTGTKAGAGAATGLVAGGILGGLGGWLVGIGALAIPGVGPFIAAGALGSALAGAAIGAGVGVIAGALIGMGIPEDEARYYEDEVRAGRTLVAVKAGSRFDEATRLLRQHGAYDIETRDTAMGSTPVMTGTAAPAMVGTTGAASMGDWSSASPYYRDRYQQQFKSTGQRYETYEPAYRYGWEMRNRPEYRGRSWAEVEPTLRQDWEQRHHDMPWDRVRDMVHDTWEHDDVSRGTATARGERTVQLHAEELTPVKERVKTGEVEVRKEVVTEQKTMNVPVTREEVVVERHPVTPRPADRADFHEEGETIRVPVTEERVRLEKQPVVTEEVTVGTRAVRDTEAVSGTVRREEARVEREGDVNVRGWDQARSRYQQRWQQSHGTTGARWQDVEPGYQYGYTYRQDPRYRGRNWTDVEPELRRDWEGRYRDRPWDRARENVREAWEDATS